MLFKGRGLCGHHGGVGRGSGRRRRRRRSRRDLYSKQVDLFWTTEK